MTSAMAEGIVEQLLMTAVDVERKHLHTIDHMGEHWRLVNPDGEKAAIALREAASTIAALSEENRLSMQTIADERERADKAEAGLATARNDALEQAAQAAYRTCAETRHVTLGDAVSEAILALKEADK